MSRPNSSSTTAQDIIAALAVPPPIDTLGPIAGRFIHALRLIALHERIGRDPVPELAVRLGSVDIAAKSLILAHAISSTWPENIHVSRFCCRLLSHDEASIGGFVDAASRRDRAGFEAILGDLIRTDRMHRLWEAALALIAAEMRKV
ncbi:DNA-directed RNA polymerase subunit beta' [Erythrobacter sanguineus]|jgi:hypothetical protein|uniref:Uncharacterized protein n=1 Tax=Erythrobacter sanguineus TaxID=198312 RepID=A0A1M7SLG9_9SPHN|nr:DNA-directed RNA polymerase subunit beta' [Erythrobacter sanguineus]MCR9179795.1 DNA-directed RNA polymerase subunit beta' [Erythrobacteraceae bacterium]SHN59297.1 hypothetical protein SAMN02745193_01972 [Erythrobacter sanguineus]